MQTLSLEGTRGQARRRVAVISAATHALARSEHRNERPDAIKGAGLPAWRRFKGRLSSADYVELLIENAAASQPFAFDLPSLLDDPEVFADLPHDLADEWTESINLIDLDGDPDEFITDVARNLKLPTRLNRGDLNKLLPHHRVLELPGTGGQLALYLTRRDDSVFLADSFTIACATWQERFLAGLVAVECQLTGTAPVISDATLETSRALHSRYDHVIGLHPDRGGQFAANQLALWFPTAKIKLI